MSVIIRSIFLFFYYYYYYYYYANVSAGETTIIFSIILCPVKSLIIVFNLAVKTDTITRR